LSVFRGSLFVLLVISIAPADDAVPAGYQKGTITKDFTAAHKSYDLQDVNGGYQISNCGDFQNGQVVGYRVKEDKIYITLDGSNEYKCTIEAKWGQVNPDAAKPTRFTYEKGTIEGYEVRRDISVFGGGQGSSVGSAARKAKVYELHGADLIYKIDYCGAFQAGKFSTGQVVEYRVDGKRLYIRHDNDQEYKCQIEGTREPENAKQESAKTNAASPAAAPAFSGAKLSISSVPDGADIEVDGNFSGNTPSDLEVPEGPHTITVKKSGYKDWQRDIKIAAGSSVHLNAEMERTP